MTIDSLLLFYSKLVRFGTLLKKRKKCILIYLKNLINLQNGNILCCYKISKKLHIAYRR